MQLAFQIINFTFKAANVLERAAIPNRRNHITKVSGPAKYAPEIIHVIAGNAKNKHPANYQPRILKRTKQKHPEIRQGEKFPDINVAGKPAHCLAQKEQNNQQKQERWVKQRGQAHGFKVA